VSEIEHLYFTFWEAERFIKVMVESAFLVNTFILTTQAPYPSFLSLMPPNIDKAVFYDCNFTDVGRDHVNNYNAETGERYRCHLRFGSQLKLYR
jgi:hypothetical protein